MTMKIGRNAGNGQFTTVETARRKPATHIVETVKPQPAPKPASSKPKK